MKKYTSFFALFLAILIFDSCSTTSKVISDNRIQKRKYNKGFHIHKKGKAFENKKVFSYAESAKYNSNDLGKDNRLNIQNKLEIETNNNSLSASNKNKIESELKQFHLPTTIKQNVHFENTNSKYDKLKSKLARKINAKINNLFLQREDDKTTIEPLGLIGLFISGASLPIFVILSFSAGIVLGFVSCSIMGLLALIFGIISLNRIKKNPEKYNITEAKKYAILSIVLGSLAILLFPILYLVFILLWYI